MKVSVNKDICIGCGTCVTLCPEVFELKDDMKAHVKDGADLDKNDPSTTLGVKKCIIEAKDSCPVQAIEVE